MRVFLAIVLDKIGRIKKILYETESLQELDEYMQKYRSSTDVREEYTDEIETFLHENKLYLENLELKALQENRKPRKNFGMIMEGFYGKENHIYFVPAIYQNFQLIKRVNMADLQKHLEDDAVFKKLLDGRSYLFGKADNTLKIMSLYRQFKYVKYKKMLLEILMQRIRESSKEQKYYYFRCLANMGDLIKPVTIKTNHGKIDCYHIPNDKVVFKRDRITDDCNDEFFMSICDKDDYEKLFNYYDLEEISKYSKDKDNPLGLRR